MRAPVANRQRSVRVRSTALSRAALTAMRAERCAPSSEASIAVVSDAQIRALNRRYLGRDRATDVLAFPQIPRRPPGQDPRKPPGQGSPGGLLGDVVVSAERAAAQAPRYGQTVEGELELLVIHGVLHLLGYDDATPRSRLRMRRREGEILAALRRAKAPRRAGR